MRKPLTPNRIDYASIAEDEKKVLDKASRIYWKLENEGKIRPHATDKELLDVDASDEEYEVLLKAVEILEKHVR